MKNVNPFNPLYMQGFKAGKEHTVNEFAKRFEKLQNTKGIGPKTIKKMVEVMNLPINTEEDDNNGQKKAKQKIKGTKKS